MIKAVFFDIDGTLLDHDSGVVSSATRNTIERLKRNNIKVFIATGRHILEMKELDIKDMVFDGYVLLNGQICLDSKENLIYSNPIDQEDTNRIITMFKEKKTPIVLVEEKRMYINKIDQYVETTQNDISTSLPPIEDYTGNPIYLAIPYGQDERIQAFLKPLKTCKSTKWNPYAHDVLPKDSGKVAGIEHMLSLHNIKPEETMAIGDGDNDIDMLTFAGIGIAMGNADDEVKRHATAVTETISNEGVSVAIKKYLNI